jgi:predicted DNA binding CopG/RHH family protein
MKKPLVLPKFKNEDEEFEFWSNLDSSEYLEASDLKPFNIDELINMAKPKTRKMTIRLPENWIVQAKAIAVKLDIPYQSLIKQFIHQGLEEKKRAAHT